MRETTYKFFLFLRLGVVNELNFGFDVGIVAMLLALSLLFGLKVM